MEYRPDSLALALSTQGDEQISSIVCDADDIVVVDESHSSTINNFRHELENNVNVSCSNTDQNCESENEFDGLDQQPIEAIDTPNSSGLTQKGQAGITMNVSFHSEAETSLLNLPLQTNSTNDESYSIGTMEISRICDETTSQQSADMSKNSLCVPYNSDTPETHEISADSNEIKKNKVNCGHIMISYNHSTKEICTRIAQKLRDHNYLVWIDSDNISGDIFTSMASAVENAFVVLLAVNEGYFCSRYCRLEAEYAVERNKAYIPMLMQPNYKSGGWLGIINGSKLHIDFCQMTFDQAFYLLLREIEVVRDELGVTKLDETKISSVGNCSSLLTTPSSWTMMRSVQEWNEDDVIEWLYREKLILFQNTLTNFTGAALYQFYKMKLISPTDYYRTVETLLPPDAPFRLFHNLTFNGALELLFASPIYNKR